jgi:ribosome-binding factor A
MVRRHTQVEEMVAHMAGEFLAREGGVKALITVTHAEMTDDFKQATIYISVLPATHEDEALKFAKRARTDMRDYIKKHSRLHPIPVVDFVIDFGEKNRQRIDDLTRTKPA